MYELLKLLDTLDNRLSLQATLEQIQNALTNLASAPAQPQHQNDLAVALKNFESAVQEMRTSLSPSQLSAINEIGGADFFDPAMADKVQIAVQSHAMTPAVARDLVQDLATRRKKFLSTVGEVLRGLQRLNITESKLEPGSADVAFVIPRDIFKNELGAFAKELAFISRLMQHFDEGLTGETAPVELEQLSSSVPTVTLMATASVLLVLGTVINKFLDAWLKIEKIRKIRTDLTEMGIKRAAVEELTEEITTTVNQIVEESAVLVLRNYEGEDGRKSELGNAVRQDVRRLFGQIERGLTVEFRAKPQTEDTADDEKQKALQGLSTLGMQLKFPEVACEPLLLASGEVIEGELKIAAKHSKKTTTTTMQKATKKESPKGE